MAERKPLVIGSGNRPAELPAGDNLPYSVLPQAWTHPSLGAPLGSMLIYAAIARGENPPDTFAFWATETAEEATDALVTITGTGYLGFDLVNSDRARENLGLGELATKDTVDVLSPIVFGAASDNGISTGVKRTVYFPKERTITGWHIGADTIGDIALQLWVSSSYAPSITDNIVGTCGLTAEQYASGNVSDWAAVTIPAGSWVSFVVATVSNINRFDVTFEVTP